jgi:hypothetical protein
MAAENFNNIDKSVYVEYMEKICETNTTVKNRQFHATLSCKGRELSPEELTAIGKDWMNE